MSSDNTDAAPADPEIFSAIITPHRSLGPRGFAIFMIWFGGLAVISGMPFVLIGAWPIFGFFGLEVLLVYLAFRANYRAARAYEEVTVTASELTLRQVSHRGAVREWTLNPLWVRLDRIVHEEFGIERLFLVSHGRRLPIAASLGPNEKASFAQRAVGRVGRSQARPDAELTRRIASGEWRIEKNPPYSLFRYSLFALTEIGWLRGGLRPRSGANDGGSHVVARSHVRLDGAIRSRRRL